MKYRTLLPGAALAVLVLAASACSSGGTSGGTGVQANTAADSDTARVTVTAAQARRVFDSYVSATASALASDDKQAALAVTTGVARETVTYQFLAASRSQAKPPAYRYGTPVFYRPALSSYPQWFVASVPRTASTAATPADTAGVALSTRGQALMVFAKNGPSSPWLLTSSAQLAPGQSLPALATSSDGDNETVPRSDTATLSQPQVTGPLQATIVDDGPSSAASRAVAAGPLTTGIYAYMNAPAPRYAAPRGDVRQWALEGTNYDSFALRTASGGAVVFYAMYLNTIVEVPSELDDASPLVAGPPISVPTEFTPLLPVGAEAPKYNLTTQLTLAFAAVDPSASAANPKIQVIAIGGGPNWASAS